MSLQQYLRTKSYVVFNIILIEILSIPFLGRNIVSRLIYVFLFNILCFDIKHKRVNLLVLNDTSSLFQFIYQDYLICVEAGFWFQCNMHPTLTLLTRHKDP